MDDKLIRKTIQILNDLKNKELEIKNKELEIKKEQFIEFLNKLDYPEMAKSIEKKGMPKIIWYAKNMSTYHSIFDFFSINKAEVSPFLSDFNITLFWGKKGGVEFTYIDKHELSISD